MTGIGDATPYFRVDRRQNDADGYWVVSMFQYLSSSQDQIYFGNFSGFLWRPPKMTTTVQTNASAVK